MTQKQCQATEAIKPFRCLTSRHILAGLAMLIGLAGGCGAWVYAQAQDMVDIRVSAHPLLQRVEAKLDFLMSQTAAMEADVRWLKESFTDYRRTKPSGG